MTIDELKKYGFVEQPGSGAFTGSGSKEYIFKAVRNSAATAVVWERLRSAAAAGEQYNGQHIQFGSCKIGGDATFDTVYLVTGPRPGKSSPPERANGETVTSLSISYMEKQIETHPNYRAHWSNDLFFAVEATDEELTSPKTPSLPSWYDNARDTNIAPADQKKFRWGQQPPPDQSVKEGGVQKTYRWLLLKKRTKPGVEVYPFAAPTVTERIFFRTRSQAENNLRRANAHVAPRKTYIYSKDPKNWIVQPQGVEESDGYFITVNVYTYADKWDEDIWST